MSIRTGRGIGIEWHASGPERITENTGDPRGRGEGSGKGAQGIEAVLTFSASLKSMD